MKKEIAGKEVEVNEDGYMLDSSQWNEDIAKEIAKEEGIEELTDDHWEVINFLREDFEEQGKLPSIRRVNKTGGIPIKKLYSLFPGGPLKKASKIAGHQKPSSCV